MKHATLSASSAHRWMLCSGSVMLEKDMPDVESFYAKEGTAAHALGELCLTKQRPPEKYIGTTIEGFDVDSEMAHHVATYVDFCNVKKGKEHFVELRVDFSKYADGGFGTADFVTVDEGVLSICDLKYGMGVRVNAAENPQLMLYGLGALSKFPVNEVDAVEMNIVQPRLDHISTYTLRAKDLIEWGETIVRPAAKRALSGDPVFVAGETQCRWCKAKPVCKTVAKKNYEVTLSMFDDLDAPLLVQTPHTLNDEDIGKLLPKMDGLIGWAEAIKKHAHKRLLDGAQVGDWKLVVGRGARRWKDEHAAATTLKDLFGEKAYITKLVSPAQAEKLDRKKKQVLDELIIKTEGKPSLAPPDDPRPRLKPEVTFANIEEIQES